jgi:ribosomal protein L22
MSEIDRYIPIADIQTPRIRTQIDLPYHLEDRIGLNTKYLQTLIQIAGIKHVRISTENTKTPETKVSITGINNDGSAIAGKAKAESISTHSQSLQPDNPKLTSSKNYSWPSLNIVLNPNETRDQLLDSSGNNYSELKNPNNWSREINKAIKNAIRNAGRKNLVETTPTLLDGMWIAGLGFSLTPFLSSQFPDPHNILFHYGMRYFSQTFVIFTENFQKGEGYRLSLIAGYELDRFALLQAYSRLKPVVVPLEKN